MSGPLPIALIHSGADALSLKKSNLQCRAALALTPDALAGLAGISCDLVPLTKVLTDRRQAAIVARLRRLDGWVQEQTNGIEGLGVGGVSAFRHDLYYLSAFVMALSVALGRKGPWLLPHEGGWSLCDDRQTVLDRMVLLIGGRDGGFRPSIGCPPMPWLVRLIGKAVTSLLNGRDCVVLTCRRYGFPNLTGKAAQAGLVPVEIRSAVGRWRDLAYSIRGWWLGRKNGRHEWTIVAVPRHNPHLAGKLKSLWRRLPDASLCRALSPYEPVVVTEAELTDGVVADMGNVLKRLRTKGIIAHSMRWSSEAALCEAAGPLGVPRLLVSHGSHPDAQAGAADHPHAILADGLLVSSLADVALVQSPVAERAAAERMPCLDRLAVRPIMWGYRVLPLPSGAGRPLRVLHAGTYKRLNGWRPWIYETSLEFVEGLDRLAKAVLRLDDVELVVRIREAPECSVASLHRLLPDDPRIRIKTDGSFLDDLAEADLLVSYASTTIEEALAASRPVLLWGGSTRYRHLPGRTVAPTAVDRAPVYAVEDEASLTPMIAAILQAHAGVPLSVEETESLVSASKLPGVDDVLGMLAHGDFQRRLLESQSKG